MPHLSRRILIPGVVVGVIVVGLATLLLWPRQSYAERLVGVWDLGESGDEGRYAKKLWITNDKTVCWWSVGCSETEYDVVDRYENVLAMWMGNGLEGRWNFTIRFSKPPFERLYAYFDAGDLVIEYRMGTFGCGSIEHAGFTRYHRVSEE